MLGEEQVRRFRRDRFLLGPQVLSESEVAKLQEALCAVALPTMTDRTRFASGEKAHVKTPLIGVEPGAPVSGDPFSPGVAQVRIETFVAAPPEAVCAAALDPAVHARTAPGRERVVGVVRVNPAPAPPQGEGLRFGDEVTFEATHLGVRQRLTARITMLDAPFAFEDTMVRGAFRRLWHRHEFHAEPDGTRMVDRMEFASPLGRWFDRLVLAPYLRRFLEKRGEALAKVVSEPPPPAPPPPARGRV